MKKLILALSIFITTFSSGLCQDKTGYLYESNEWNDIKGKGDWAKAMDNPTKEYTRILIASDSLIVKLGKKQFRYSISKIEKASDMMTNYHVTLGSSKNILYVGRLPDGKYLVGIENNWSMQCPKRTLVLDVNDVR